MSYFPQKQSKYEVTAGEYQLKSGGGHFDKLIIHLKGKNRTDVWRVWDAIGPTDLTAGKIIWASYVDDPKVQAGCIIDLDWTCHEGVFLQVPEGGVCSVSWI
jgi:hypothetical protein